MPKKGAKVIEREELVALVAAAVEQALNIQRERASDGKLEAGMSTKERAVSMLRPFRKVDEKGNLGSLATLPLVQVDGVPVRIKGSRQPYRTYRDYIDTALAEGHKVAVVKAEKTKK